MDDKARQMVLFGVKRANAQLFKRFLEILERLGDEHDESLAKLREHLPGDFKKYVDLADHFTPAQGDLLRKEVLDAGGDSYRAMETLLQDFDIDFKR